MNLIDRDKLIDELKRYSDDMCVSLWNDIVCLINEQPTVNEWIPVSERLPEEAGEYIIAQEVYSISEPSKLLRTEATTAYFMSGKFRRNKHFKVIAWMPIPTYRENE